jgi:multimeric flavodoxin WrbA
LNMKVVAVLGSAHENGASSTIVKEILRGAKQAGHETVMYEIEKLNVRGCQGCGYCRTNSKDCKIDDDLKSYWKDLHESGALIVSSPNYYANVTGPMITYMNRHYCLTDKEGNSRLHPGIKLVGVFAQGNGDKDFYTANYNWFLGTFQKRDMPLVETFVKAGREPLEKDGELLKKAFETGKSL